MVDFAFAAVLAGGLIAAGISLEIKRSWDMLLHLCLSVFHLVRPNLVWTTSFSHVVVALFPRQPLVVAGGLLAVTIAKEKLIEDSLVILAIALFVWYTIRKTM